MYTFDLFLNTAYSLFMYLGVMMKHSSAIVDIFINNYYIMDLLIANIDLLVESLMPR